MSAYGLLGAWSTIETFGGDGRVQRGSAGAPRNRELALLDQAHRCPGRWLHQPSLSEQHR